MLRTTAVVMIVGLMLVAACSPSSTQPSSTPAAASPSIAVPPADVPSAASTETPQPSIAADEPLILYYHCLSLCGTPEGTAGIFVMRPDGTGIQRVGGDVSGAAHKHPDWSPDGQRVVFIDQDSERMWIANLDGSPSVPVETCDQTGCDYPAWSPDGTRIVFSRYETEDDVIGPSAVGIYILDLASGDVSEVVRLERPLLADVPRWSPDGTHLVFGVDRMDNEANETGSAIAVVHFRYGDPRYITDFERFGYYPDWNRQTGEIVFSTETLEFKKEPGQGDDAWNLYGIQPDGTGLRQITDVPAGIRLWNPRWTPDGTLITAADLSTFMGLYVDPTTGQVDPFPTAVQLARPQLRPLPKP